MKKHKLDFGLALPIEAVACEAASGRILSALDPGQGCCYGCALMEATARRSSRGRPDKSAEDGVCKTFFVDEVKVASVLAAMPAPSEIEGIADLFGVLSDPTRVRMLYALTREELCVCDLARVVARSMPATSHQLQLLRRMRLVKCRVDGKLAYYSLDDSRVKRLVQDAVRQSNAGGAL